jgi:hypothetical protein
MLAALMIGNHFSISALWCARSAAGQGRHVEAVELTFNLAISIT